MPDKAIKIFNKEFVLPSINSDKEKRQKVSNLRTERRNAIKNNDGTQTNREIRQNFNQQIRNQRGGKTWAGEVISDGKEFISDVKQLQSDLQNTVVGKVFNQAKDVAKAVTTMDPQRLVQEGADTFNLVKSIVSKKDANTPTEVSSLNKPQDGCNCG